MLATRVLDQRCPAQKSIGLKKLQALDPEETRFSSIGQAVRRAAALGSALGAQ